MVSPLVQLLLAMLAMMHGERTRGCPYDQYDWTNNKHAGWIAEHGAQASAVCPGRPDPRRPAGSGLLKLCLLQLSTLDSKLNECICFLIGPNSRPARSMCSQTSLHIGVLLYAQQQHSGVIAAERHL